MGPTQSDNDKQFLQNHWSILSDRWFDHHKTELKYPKIWSIPQYRLLTRKKLLKTCKTMTNLILTVHLAK